MESFRKQGNEAEMIAVLDYCKRGYEIFLPFGAGGTCDFIAVKDSETVKVEVKSANNKRGVVCLKRRHYKSSVPYSSTSDITYLVNLITGTTKELLTKELLGRTSIKI